MSDQTGGYASDEQSRRNESEAANQKARDQQVQSNRDAQSYQDGLAASDRRNAEAADIHRSSVISSMGAAGNDENWAAAGKRSEHSYHGAARPHQGSGKVGCLIMIAPFLLLLLIRLWVGSIGDWYTTLTCFALAAPIALMVSVVLYGESVWSARWGRIGRLIGIVTRLVLGLLSWAFLTGLLTIMFLYLKTGREKNESLEMIDHIISTHPDFSSVVLGKLMVTLFAVGVVRFICVVAK